MAMEAWLTGRGSLVDMVEGMNGFMTLSALLQGAMCREACGVKLVKGGIFREVGVPQVSVCSVCWTICPSSWIVRHCVVGVRQPDLLPCNKVREGPLLVEAQQQFRQSLTINTRKLGDGVVAGCLYCE